MKPMLFAALSVSVLVLSGTASANPAAKLAQLETKLDRLTTYFDANCDPDALTPQCKRVEKSVSRIGEELTKLGEVISVALRDSIEVSTSNAGNSGTKSKEASLLTRQYNILLARLNKIETFIERLEASDDPKKESKIRGLETQLTLVRSRLLSLQSQMEEG